MGSTLSFYALPSKMFGFELYHAAKGINKFICEFIRNVIKLAIFFP